MSIKQVVASTILSCVFTSLATAHGTGETDQSLSSIDNKTLSGQRYGVTTDQQQNLKELWDDAMRFSGIRAPENDSEPPPVYVLDQNTFSQKLCPEKPSDCRSMAALYDTETKSVYARLDVSNPDGDYINKSYIVHELVHSLQDRYLKSKGIESEELYKTCDRLFNTEQQAYAAQNNYLQSWGELFTAGRYVMRFTFCGGKTLEEAKKADNLPPLIAEKKPSVASREPWYNPLLAHH